LPAAAAAAVVENKAKLNTRQYRDKMNTKKNKKKKKIEKQLVNIFQVSANCRCRPTWI